MKNSEADIATVAAILERYSDLDPETVLVHGQDIIQAAIYEFFDKFAHADDEDEDEDEDEDKDEAEDYAAQRHDALDQVIQIVLLGKGATPCVKG